MKETKQKNFEDDFIFLISKLIVDLSIKQAVNYEASNHLSKVQ